MLNKTIATRAYIFFILGALLVIFLFPGERIFGESVSKEEETKAKELFMQSFKPIFKLDEKVAYQQIDKFLESAAIEDLFDNEAYKTLIKKLLMQVYSKGVVSIGEYLFLQENNVDSIRYRSEGVSVSIPVSEIYTPKSAYHHIYHNLLNDSYIRPSSEELQSLNINAFIRENLVYDKIKSEKAQQEGLKKIEHRIGFQRHYGYFSGVSLLVAVFFTCFFFYFYYLRKSIYKKRRDVFFAVSMAVMFIVLTEIIISLLKINYIYIIPYAIIPIVVRTFFDSRTAQMTHLMTITICSLLAPLPFDFFIMQLIVCMAAIYALKDLTRRSELIRCAFFTLGAYLITYICLLLYRNGDLSAFNPWFLLYFSINFVFIMFAYPLIYIIEKLFGYISNVTLVELSDINSPVLRRLSETCPGTFQHSLQVSMLGAEAASKVDANPQLVRTGALYHDIGKIRNPLFFIENQTGGINPHNSIPLEESEKLIESARIITAHVPDGIEIAEQANMPNAIVHFIKTHHGKGITKYFYNTFKNKFPDKEVDEALFRYKGENPDSRETAILMMADAVEAASRSLTDYSEESLRNLIDKIIDGQVADGLLDDAPLTFKNIKDIKKVFLDKMLTIYHLRIAYPEAEKVKPAS